MISENSLHNIDTQVVIGHNLFNIDRLPTSGNMYRVVNKVGKELAAKFSRDVAHVVCCALSIHELEPGFRNESVVYLSLLDNKYRATRPPFSPAWEEVRIGTIADIRKWHSLIGDQSSLYESVT